MQSKYKALYDAALLWLYVIEDVCNDNVDNSDIVITGTELGNRNYLCEYYIVERHRNNNPYVLKRCACIACLKTIIR